MKRSRGKLAEAAGLAALAAALVCGCDGFGGGARRGGVGGSGTSSAAPAISAEPTPAPQFDEDDRYTVLLYTFTGPEHIAQSRYYKANTVQQAGWDADDLFILHQAHMSRLFWGRCRTYQQAQRLAERAQAYTPPRAPGMHPYEGATVMEIPGYQVGPPQWDLRNVSAAYTVLVGVYWNDPDAVIKGTNRPYIGRQEFAVTHCQELREQGEEAYYYHDVTQSIVTVGTFGPAAVREEQQPNPRGGIVTKRVIADPAVGEVLRRHRWLVQNGARREVAPANMPPGQRQWLRKPSYVIRVPGKEDHGAPGLTDRAGDEEPRKDSRDRGGAAGGGALDELRRRLGTY